jgi:hypothetical protein
MAAPNISSRPVPQAPPTTARAPAPGYGPTSSPLRTNSANTASTLGRTRDRGDKSALRAKPEDGSKVEQIDLEVHHEQNGQEHLKNFTNFSQAKRAQTEARLRMQGDRRRTMNPGQLKGKATELWGDQGEEKLATLAREGLFKLRGSGQQNSYSPEALQSSLKERSPYERFLILSKMSSVLAPGTSPERTNLEEAVAQLHEHHGDEVIAAERAAPAFAKLDEVSETGSQDLHALYLNAGRTTGDAVVTARKLAEGLMAKFGAKNFDTALQQITRTVSSELIQMQPTRHATRVQVAMTNSAAFDTVRKAAGLVGLKRSNGLRQMLAADGLKTEKTDGEVAVGLLQQCEQGTNDPHQFAQALFGEESRIVLDSSKLLRHLRKCINETPPSWWPPKLENTRFQLLKSINSRLEVLGNSGKQPDFARKEQTLRAQAKMVPKVEAPKTDTSKVEAPKPEVTAATAAA